MRWCCASRTRLSYEAQRGLYLHPTYVVTPQREPLGVINAWTWARELKPDDAPRPGVLESVRWVESYERIAEHACELPGTRHVVFSNTGMSLERSEIGDAKRVDPL